MRLSDNTPHLSARLWLGAIILLVVGSLLACRLGNAPQNSAQTEPTPTAEQLIPSPSPVVIPTSTVKADTSIAVPSPASPASQAADRFDLSARPGCPNPPPVESRLILTPTLSVISFSAQQGPDGWPINPTLQFTQTLTRVLATFNYLGLRNGLTWERVWYYGDQELQRGSGVWSAGPNGKLTIQAVTQTDGFTPGRYRLELYVNGQLLSQGGFIVTTPNADTQQPVQVAYTTWDGQKHQLNLLNLTRNITETLLDFARTPAWSPDTIGLLYIAEAGQAEGEPGLSVFNMGQRKSYPINPEITSPTLAWSPHRTFIATTVISDDGPSLQLWDLPQNLGYTGPPGEGPVWSPDGLRLAYRACDATGWHINTLPVISHTFDTGGIQTLTSGDDSQPSWSWDGQQVAFVRREGGNAAIYTVKTACAGQPAGCETSLTRLTKNPAADVSPAWTPDGRLLFRSQREGGQWGLYLMNSDGSAVTKLADTPPPAQESPDPPAVSTDTLMVPPAPPKPPMPAGHGLLAISNQRNNDEMTFTIDNTEHKIGPYQLKMLPLKPGHYTWTASWPGKNSRTGIADIAAGQVSNPVVER